jgi:hypothetical protein
MNRVLCCCLLLFVATNAESQKQPVELDSCIHRIPSSSLKRVPVFLQATADSAERLVLPSADFLAQDVAFKIREVLGATGPQLAEGDSAVDWSRLWGEVIVTLHRDAKPTWKVPDWSMRADTIARSSISLLVRAIKAVVDEGELIPYPDGVPGDSISFSLSLVNPTVTEKGKILPVVARQPIPVFSIAIAWERSAEVIKPPPVSYPEYSRSIRAIGGVRLTYVVNKSGRVEPETIKEAWPAGVAKPQGQLLLAYEAFLRAVQRGVPSAKFSPAMVGGCPVRQVVQQYFDFRIP